MREKEMLLDAFLACRDLVEMCYRWRPNPPDESDNHVQFPDIVIQSPAGWLKKA